MSWSARFVKRPGATAEQTEFEVSNVDEVPEHVEQYREAITAAFGVLLSGVVGSTDKSYLIVLSGHGNENHEPADGWANDQLTISISQLDGES